MRHPSLSRHATQTEMISMTESLVAEYAGLVPAGSVIRCVARCREHLLRTGVRDGLVPATEAAARVRLATVMPVRAIA